MRMRESVSRPLGEAQACVEMQDYECAHRLLERVRARENLYAYEEALMWRFYAFVYFEQDDMQGAISAYESLLAVPELPGGLEQESSLTLAQLYAQEERFEDALRLLDRWFAIVADPGPDQHYFRAQLLWQLGRYAQGVEPLETAIALADARGRPPREGWYNLLRSFYFETGDDASLLAVLRTLVENWPKEEYVTHLAAMYGRRGEPDLQLALVEAAYEAGWLDRGSELVSYASMLLGADIPYKAATVLQDGLDTGLIEPSLENWRMLGQAWRLAQEDRRSLPALEAAAELADDGRVYLQLASSHQNLAEPEQCVDAAREGLRRGVERAAEAHLVLGACLADLRRYEEARRAFETAAQDEDSRRLARDYLDYLDGEQDLQRQLDEALATLQAEREPSLPPAR